MTTPESLSDQSGEEKPPNETLPATLPDAVVDGLTDLFLNINTRVVAEIRRAEAEHTEKLTQVLSQMHDRIRKELRNEIRQEFESRFHKSMEELQEQFRIKLQESATTPENTPAEIADLLEHSRSVQAELLGKEAELEYLEREAAVMLDDPDVELSRMIRHNAARNEIRTYINGLRFHAGVPNTDK